MTDLFGNVAISTQPPDARPAGESRARGAYFTPDALAAAIAGTLLRCPYPRRIFEPGCGGGAFLRAASRYWPKADLLGVDLVPACDGPGTVLKGDLFQVGRGEIGFDLIIGNPDFAIAEKVVRHCLGLLSERGVLAMLLRISFLSSQARVPLYREHPLFSFTPIAGRPSFTGGGSDTSEYGIFVWAPSRMCHGDHGRLHQPLEWRR